VVKLTFQERGDLGELGCRQAEGSQQAPNWFFELAKLIFQEQGDLGELGC
jgi:hypothetical protein